MLQALLLLVLLTGNPADSVTPPPADSQDAGPPRGRPGRGPFSPVEVVNMLDAYAVVQARNALQLDDTQYGTFVARLKQLQQTRRRVQQDRHRILQQLRRLTAPHVAQIDEPAVRANLKALRDLDERAAVEIRKAYDAVDEVLDARQQARFRVFEENLERRKLDLLLRAQQGAPGPRR